MASPGDAPQAAAGSSSSFLGFSSVSRDPGLLPSRRVGGRGGRNRKKGWKRWRGPEAKLGRELGDWLEERASELRHLGGPVTEKPDESLFFVDTSNRQQDQKEKPAKERPLKIDLILQPDSKVPPPKDILSYQVPNGRKLKRKQRLWEKLAEKGLVPRKERLLQQRLQNPPKANPAGAGDSGTDPSRDFYDIWADSNPLDKALAGQDTFFLEQTKKQPVKRPDRLRKAPSELPAMEVISSGGSYNPSFQSHQALLLQAFEVELLRQKAEERLQRQLNFPTVDEAPTQESAFQEQCEGLLEEESEGEGDSPTTPQEEDLQAASGEAPHLATAAAGEKKTERQRKKEKAAKHLRIGAGDAEAVPESPRSLREGRPVPEAAALSAEIHPAAAEAAGGRAAAPEAETPSQAGTGGRQAQTPGQAEVRRAGRGRAVEQRAGRVLEDVEAGRQHPEGPIQELTETQHYRTPGTGQVQKEIPSEIR